MMFALVLLAVLVASAAHANGGMWMSNEEIMRLPMSGAAWSALKAQADQPAGSPDVSNQDQMNNVYVLAKALVYVRTGIESYRTEVRAQCIAAINTELGGRTLALGRELAAYVIAADLVELEPAERGQFSEWLRRCLSETLDGMTLRGTHERRPNNWGTHAGASRVACAIYLGDQAELARAAQVFKGWLGDRASYSGFTYGSLDWQCDPAAPVGVNPPGCMKQGHSIDGVLPDDQRRNGGFTWPPPCANYVWGGLDGVVVQAALLHRAGYPAFDWESQAIRRAYVWLHDQAGCQAGGDNEWQPHLVNAMYQTNFPARTPASPGKNMAWTDWTHSAPGAPPPDQSKPSRLPDVKWESRTARYSMTLPHCQALEGSCDTMRVTNCREAEPGVDVCDTLRACNPETGLDRLRVYWQERYAPSPRVLMELDVRGLEGQPYSLELPTDTVAGVWVTTLDKAGNESCRSDVITANARVDVPPTAPPAIAANVWHDITGRRLHGKPTRPGIYFHGRQRVLVMHGRIIMLR